MHQFFLRSLSPEQVIRTSHVLLIHHRRVVKKPEMRKTNSNKERILADTYCQTVTMQLKIEENDSEYQSLTNRPMQCTRPTNTTLAHSTELGDPPLLQQPQQTTMSGIQQIIECFLSGTVQAKLILLKEVDTIFECQLCRSLFRGLPNLLEHRSRYCLSRQPDPVDPSQAMKDLLEAVFPERDWPKMSPVRTHHSPLCQDQPVPNSQQQDSTSQSCRKPVVVLKRVEHPHTADQVHIVSPGLQETASFEQPERKNDGKEESLSDVHNIIISAKPKQPDSDLQQDTVSQRCPKKQRSSSLNTAVGENIPYVPRLKNIFDCQVLLKQMRTDHTLRRFRNVPAKKAKTKPPPESMEGSRGDCGKPLPSPIETCHVCQKSLDKETNVHCHCNEVQHDLKQGCVTPVLVTQPVSTTTSLVPQNQSNPEPVKKSLSSQEPVHFSREADPSVWMRDLFYCGLCKCKYSSQVLLLKHMSTTHKFYMLENIYGDGRTAPPRQVKQKNKPADKVFENVRVYCWLCGKNFSSRQFVRMHCYKDHRQKLQEINMLLKKSAEPVSLAHELQNGFAASQTSPKVSLPAR